MSFAILALVLTLSMPALAGFESAPESAMDTLGFQVKDNILYSNAEAEKGSNNSAIFMKGLTFNFRQFKLDTEVNFLWASPGDFLQDASLELKRWSSRLDLAAEFGAAEFAIGSLHMEGVDSSTGAPPKERAGFRGFDERFRAPFIPLREKVGLLWYRGDVSNTTPSEPTGDILGDRGYKSLYLRGFFKISDTMKTGAVFSLVQANEIEQSGIFYNIGQELNISFEWDFMDNLSYIIDAGYFKAGDHSNDDGMALDSKDIGNHAYGFRQDFVISW